MDLIGGSQMKNQCRNSDIIVDAAYLLMTSELRETGQSYLDERLLRQAGQVDFEQYNFVKGYLSFADASLYLMFDLYSLNNIFIYIYN